MNIILKCDGYKGEGMGRILEYLSENGSGQQLIKLDQIDKLNGIDLIFDTLKISNLKLEIPKDNKYGNEYTASFNCTYEVANNILKLIYNLKKLGDGGHSYEVKINKKSFSWDGDGSDRVNSINGKDCTHLKHMEKEYYNYIKKETDELTEQYIIENTIKF